MYIGSDYPDGEPSAQGSIASFQAYNRVLPPNEVSNLASGCPQ